MTSGLRLVVGTECAKAPPRSGKIFATREEDTFKCYGSPLDKGFPPDRVLFLLVGRVGNVDGMPTLSLPPNHSYFIALLHRRRKVFHQLRDAFVQVLQVFLLILARA